MYIEDAGHCSVVRQQVANELEKYEMNELSSISDNLQISKLIMHWRRMFEADIDVSYKL